MQVIIKGNHCDSVTQVGSTLGQKREAGLIQRNVKKDSASRLKLSVFSLHLRSQLPLDISSVKQKDERSTRAANYSP